MPVTRKMTTTVSHISRFFNKWAPQSTKLDYDNVGLLVGNSDNSVTKILTCLDVTDEVVEEAIEQKCDLIVSHHPLIFRGMKRINADSLHGAIIYKLIRNDISVIAAHTNLDAARGGVSFILARTLGLSNIQFLDDSYPLARYLSVSIPVNAVDSLKERLENIGVEDIEVLDYSKYDGSQNRVKLEARIEAYQEFEVKKLFEESLPGNNRHYQIFKLVNDSDKVGMGAIGDFQEPIDVEKFLNLVSDRLSVEAIRYSGFAHKIKKVAVCGGAGVSLTSLARSRGADAFITADVKYHDYFIEKGSFMLLDVGHYESEVPVIDVMKNELNKEFKDVDVITTRVRTSPMQVHINEFQSKNNPENQNDQV
jgi:dinuclear metal center YbgI/SA1388 family protein